MAVEGNIPTATPQQPFDAEFQKSLLRLLCEDSRFGHAIGEHLQPQFFENEALRWAWSYALRFKEQYGAFPGVRTILQQTRTMDPKIRPIYEVALEQVKQASLKDEAWMRDAVLDFVKRNLFVRTFQESRSLYNSGKVEKAYDLMMSRMERLQKTTWGAADEGWFFEEIADRQVRRMTDDPTSKSIATGFDLLDHVLNGGLSKGELGLWVSYAKTGKALRNDQPVLTPTGERSIGSLKVGDEVIGGSTGVRQFVLGVHPQGVKPLYDVKFRDGASVIASEDHLWKVKLGNSVGWGGRGHWRTVPTSQIVGRNFNSLDGRVVVPNPPQVVGYRYIESVTPVSPAACTCITVDDPEGLFLTAGHVVTHNSTMLTQQGMAATRLQLRRTAHFVFEGSRAQVEDRYESGFTEQVYRTVRTEGLTSARYQEAYQNYQLMKGCLYIRGFTEEWNYTCADVHECLKDLKRQHGWVPDLVIIDYGDLLNGRGTYANDRENQKAAFRDLKSLANRGYAVWSASQAQRPEKGAENDAHWLYARQIADCYEKVRVADFIGSLNITNAERKAKVMRLLAELYRDNEADERWVVRCDFSTMTIKSDPTAISPSMQDLKSERGLMTTTRKRNSVPVNSIPVPQPMTANFR